MRYVWFVNTTNIFNISFRVIHRRYITEILTFISWVNFMICSSRVRFAWSCPFTLCSRVSIRRTADKKELSSLQLRIDPNSNFILIMIWTWQIWSNLQLDQGQTVVWLLEILEQGWMVFQIQQWHCQLHKTGYRFPFYVHQNLILGF